MKENLKITIHILRFTYSVMLIQCHLCLDVKAFFTMKDQKVFEIVSVYFHSPYT